MEWLLDRGVDWRLANQYGDTALAVAKKQGKVEVVAVLEAWIAEHGTAEEMAELQRQHKEEAEAEQLMQRELL